MTTTPLGEETIVKSDSGNGSLGPERKRAKIQFRFQKKKLGCPGYTV